MTIVFTFAFNWSVLLPLLAKRTFEGDAATFGVMSALTGAGAFVAALITGSLAEHMGARAGFALGGGSALIARIGGQWWRSRRPAAALPSEVFAEEQLSA